MRCAHLEGELLPVVVNLHDMGHTAEHSTYRGERERLSGRGRERGGEVEREERERDEIERGIEREEERMRGRGQEIEGEERERDEI